jgi:predicted dehydrogenase
MGYNDMKAIEVRELIQAVAGEKVEVWPNFEIAHRIQRCVDATILSHQERRWVDVAEIAE